MATKPTAPKVPVLVNDPFAPDLFADEATGFYLLGDNVRITFATWRVNHEESPGSASRVVIGRLVMPLSRAEALLKGLSDFLERTRASIDESPISKA
jgi:hypothetical protein